MQVEFIAWGGEDVGRGRGGKNAARGSDRLKFKNRQSDEGELEGRANAEGHASGANNPERSVAKGSMNTGTMEDASKSRLVVRIQEAWSSW